MLWVALASMTQNPIEASSRPTWAEIDLDALAFNLRSIREKIGPRVKVLAAVKADAYGHGAVLCARRLQREGVDWFGVAIVEEALELRRAGISLPILCFDGFWPGQEGACLQKCITPVIHRLDAAEALNIAARARGIIFPVHVKIDTGMGRLGVRYDEVSEFAASFRRFESLRIEGLMTHFAAADEPDRDEFTRQQIARFRQAAEIFRAHGHRIALEHLANSAATFAYPEAHADMVRLGGALYGLWRDALHPKTKPADLRSVMSFRTRVMLLKRIRRGETLGYGCTFEAPSEMLIAVLPVGYHDGYLRALSNRGRVVVRGKFAPVVGRISMDLTLIDVSAVDGVQVGDVVTLWGGDGEMAIPVEDVAQIAGTLSYEVTCGVSGRVPRIERSAETP
jgi:alanine racemase